MENDTPGTDQNLTPFVDAGDVPPEILNFEIDADGTYAYDISPDAPVGEYKIPYLITDGNGLVSSANICVIVVEPPNQPPEIVPGEDLPDQSNLQGQEIVSVETSQKFDDSDGTIESYSATGLPNALSIDPVTGSITGTIEDGASTGGPNSDGNYPVIVTATDDDGGTVDCPFNWEVTAIPTFNFFLHSDGDENNYGSDAKLTVEGGGVLAIGDPENGVTAWIVDPVPEGFISGGRAVFSSLDDYVVAQGGEVVDSSNCVYSGIGSNTPVCHEVSFECGIWWHPAFGDAFNGHAQDPDGPGIIQSIGSINAANDEWLYERDEWPFRISASSDEPLLPSPNSFTGAFEVDVTFHHEEQPEFFANGSTENGCEPQPAAIYVIEARDFDGTSGKVVLKNPAADGVVPRNVSPGMIEGPDGTWTSDGTENSSISFTVPVGIDLVLGVSNTTVPGQPGGEGDNVSFRAWTNYLRVTEATIVCGQPVGVIRKDLEDGSDILVTDLDEHRPDQFPQ